MKVLLLNGSPRPNGNTAAALREMEQVFAQEGVETELLDSTGRRGQHGGCGGGERRRRTRSGG